MTDEKALTTQQPPSALDVYGSSDDIKRLARRIKLGLPGGDKLTNDEALTLAQIGLAHGLDVMTGEAWYIPGKGPMVGIRGLRKAARLQSNYWPDLELLTVAEKAALGIPEKAIAFRCRIFRTDMILQSAAAIKAMREAGMANAAERYAYKPAEGTGYWTPGENTKIAFNAGKAILPRDAEAWAARMIVGLLPATALEDALGVTEADALDLRARISSLKSQQLTMIVEGFDLRPEGGWAQEESISRSEAAEFLMRLKAVFDKYLPA